MIAFLSAVVAAVLVWLVQPVQGADRRYFGASSEPNLPKAAALTPIGATIASFGPSRGVPGDLWEDRARGSAGEMEAPLAALQRAMEPAGGFRPNADVERWLKEVRVGRTDGSVAGLSGPRRTQHFWGEWDAGSNHLRSSYASSDTERRISTALLTSPWQAFEFSTVRGRPTELPWSETAVRSFRYTLMEAGYTYRQPGWNVRTAATYSSSKTDAIPGLVEKMGVKRWSQSVSTSYRVTSMLTVESKLEAAPGQIDLPALAVSAEYQPAQHPDLALGIGCSYGYGRYGLLEAGATTARGMVQWRPTTDKAIGPTVTFETGYRKSGEGPRPDTRAEDMAALITLRVPDGAWRDLITLAGEAFRAP